MSKPKTQRKPTITKHVSQNQNQELQKTEKQPSWVVRGLLACRNVQIQQHQQQQQKEAKPPPEAKDHQHRKKQEQRKLQEERIPEDNSKKCKKMKCSGSLCNNTKITAKPDTSTPDIHKKRLFLNGCNSNDASSRSMKAPLTEHNGPVSASSSSLSASSNSSGAGSFRGMPFRRLSGCYECRMVVDPVLGFTRDPSLRSSICSCPDCGEIMKAESLEHHQAVKHAVSELGPEDTSKNIVEIIFHSSWLKKQSPVCKIDRILKVHNTQKTITRFEEYRDSIKAKATKLPKKHPRCIADGNELLRFHCTSFACSLGLNGSSNLCNSVPQCNICSIIKHGFKVTGGSGILTTATSGKAHDKACVDESEEKRAMLVCRVIAGRVKKNAEGGMEEYDSVAGAVGAYSNLDELVVFNPRAILPCFVVIYSGF
ncbi:hypothetical protein LR48_Vigan04g182400 [Vigna angularis]|uniref:C2H2-type domain-containing protein n=2 Tax=Phaseolus angularis TaxID=3914 RepID=A0A0L9UFY7_PHAAN|nr:uncharacterized protein LOC108330871 [Vigna angularis]KAG2399887.1 uncharacterized protein HKW66_Vig0102590 [Vigna angularis]KOM41626.1 hypothetical protein LR48_Vigan04g182400 [Vigna angularis]BAT78590.1 hypothetical protein VIGAN_02128800 [Vigna angularis var. angularis]